MDSKYPIIHQAVGLWEVWGFCSSALNRPKSQLVKGKTESGWQVSPIESESESFSVMSDSLWPRGLYSPWNSPGKNPGVGSHSLLQGISPTKGSNPGLPHCRQILYQLSHKGSPRLLEWVANPFSSRSSWPRNWTGVSCISDRFFTNWTIREILEQHNLFSEILLFLFKNGQKLAATLPWHM